VTLDIAVGTARRRTTPVRVATDSVALLMASVAFMVTGALRTKLSAVTLGPDGLGIVSQLTQLSAVVVFVSALGFSTGTRLALCRADMSDEARAQAGKGLLVRILGVACLMTALAMPAAGFFARVLLGSSQYSPEVRVALFVVPVDTALGLLLAISQSWGEFRRIAIASVATAVVGAAVTAPLLVSRSIILAVATIPIAAAVQLGCLIIASPSIRRTLTARADRSMELLKAVLSVGALSFVLGASGLIGETLVRLIMVRTGGLNRVAGYQPIYLLSTSGFELLLGAVGTVLLVHVAREVATSPREVVASSLNEVLQRTLVVVGIGAFLAQAAMLFYIPIVFSNDLMYTAPAIAWQMPVEIIRATVWIFGAALLPLSLRRHWLLAGIAVVGIQTAVVLTTVSELGLYAVSLGSAAGWLAGLLVTLNGLSRHGVRLSRQTFALTMWTSVMLTAGAASVHADRPYSISFAPIAVGITWLMPLCVLGVRHVRTRAITT
jgi:O-antigen/teichoic acid export membrane protein